MVLLGGEPGLGQEPPGARVRRRGRGRRRARALRRLRRGGAHPLRAPSWTRSTSSARATETDELRAASGAGGGELTRLLPELGARVGELPPAVEADPDTERHRLHTAVADLLAGVTRAAAGAARARGRALGRRSHAAAPAPPRARRAARVRCCSPPSATPRPTCPLALSETLADLRRYDAVRLGLAGLSGDEVAEFVRRTRRGRAGPRAAPSSRSAIRELTDGNAFLVCELWRALVETGAVELDGGEIRVTRSPAELGSPESVREVVSRAAVAPRARHQRPARAGGHGGRRVRARRGAARRRPGGAGAARGARRGGAQRDDRGGPAAHGLACRFTHELVRRALYDRLSGPRRAELHLRVGEALEARRGALGRGRSRTSRITSPPRRPSAGRRAPSSTTCSPRGRPPRRWPSTRRRRGCAPRWRWGSRTREERAEVFLELGAGEPPRRQGDRCAGGVPVGRGDRARAGRRAAARARGDRLRGRLLAPGDARPGGGRAARGGGDGAGGRGLRAACGTARRARPGARLPGAPRARGGRPHERDRDGAAPGGPVGPRRRPDALVLVARDHARSRRSSAMLTEARDIGEELGNTEIRAEAMSWRVPAFVALCDLESARREVAELLEIGRADRPAVHHPRGGALRGRRSRSATGAWRRPRPGRGARTSGAAC